MIRRSDLRCLNSGHRDHLTENKGVPRQDTKAASPGGICFALMLHLFAAAAADPLEHVEGVSVGCGIHYRGQRHKSMRAAL